MQQAVQRKVGTGLASRGQARRGSRRAGSAVQPAAQEKCKVAINGFGRIGRIFIRAVAKRDNPPLEVVAVNHTGGVKQAAHLLQYDSVLGTFDSNVEVADDETMVVDGQPVRVCASRDPAQLPWDQLGVDIVIEGTGVFVDSSGAGKHIQAGAKRVLITAPAKGDDIPTYVVGVNEENFDPNAEIVSNASCTTNCLAPYVKVLNDTFGIKEGQMTTTHSYTGDQRLLDASHRDLRRARAAALNVVPTSTGAAKAVSLALPEMKGKLDGFALRVPTPNVSLCDLTFTTEKPVTKRDINQSFQDARYNNPVISHVMDYTEKPLVSSDYIMTDVSTTIDGSLTQVAPSGHLAKVIAWYDNEYGYTQRVVDLSFIMAKSIQEGGAVGTDPLEEYCRESPDADECKVFED